MVSGGLEAQPDSTWHEVTLSIPFATAQHATTAMRVLGVDREMNPHLVERKMKVEDSLLIVHYRVASVRILRLASNAFLQSVDLVMRTMEEFAPAPEGEDKEEEEVLQDVQGIELKGDGKGAGGGEEVQ